MTTKELIVELLKVKDLEKEVVLYSLINIEEIDTSLPQFEFIAYNIEEIDEQNVVYLNGLT